MAPSRDIDLVTSRLVLRPTQPSDAGRYFEIQSNWNVTRMLRLAPWPASLAAMEAWLAEHQGEWAEGSAFRFAILGEGRVVGSADLDEIEAGVGDLGYWLDEAVWGQGLAREAAGALVEFGFSALGLRAITAGHAADNPASGRVLQSLGFRWAADGEKPSRPRGGIIPYRFLRLERP